MTFTGDESFAEPLRFTNELRLRRAGDRLGQALSSTPVTGHSLGILAAPPPPTPRKMRAPDREKSDLTSGGERLQTCAFRIYNLRTAKQRARMRKSPYVSRLYVYSSEAFAAKGC